MVEALFRLVNDYNSPLRWAWGESVTSSLDAMKCVNELLLKHLIPYSFRSVYCSIINTVTSIMNVPIPVSAHL